MAESRGKGRWVDRQAARGDEGDRRYVRERSAWPLIVVVWSMKFTVSGGSKVMCRAGRVYQ